MGARPCQKEAERLLKRVFDPSLVKTEWSVRNNATDVFASSNQSVYAPRLDVAVGPFNPTIVNIDEDVRAIHSFRSHSFVQRIINIGETQNGGHFSTNSNPRCLLGIEIEWKGSSKHILGDYTNASMMGLVGIVIGFSHSIEKIRRVGQYAKELRRLNKVPFELFANIVCLSDDEFIHILEDEVVQSTT